MKLFVCTDHDGHYPVGVASIIVAENSIMARTLLTNELMDNGLKVNAFTLTEIPLDKQYVEILLDGNY